MSDEGIGWWQKFKPANIFGRIGSSRALKVDDTNAPVIPKARMDVQIPSVDKDIIQDSLQSDELQSTSSIRAPVGDVLIEVDMQEEQNAQANVVNDEPDVIKDLSKVYLK